MNNPTLEDVLSKLKTSPTRPIVREIRKQVRETINQLNSINISKTKPTEVAAILNTRAVTLEVLMHVARDLHNFTEGERKRMAADRLGQLLVVTDKMRDVLGKMMANADSPEVPEEVFTIYDQLRGRRTESRTNGASRGVIDDEQPNY